MSAFDELCRVAGEDVRILVGKCGYVLLCYRGLEWTEWLLNPYQVVDLDEEWNQEPAE